MAVSLAHLPVSNAPTSFLVPDALNFINYQALHVFQFVVTVLRSQMSSNAMMAMPYQETAVKIVGLPLVGNALASYPLFAQG